MNNSDVTSNGEGGESGTPSQNVTVNSLDQQTNRGPVMVEGNVPGARPQRLVRLQPIMRYSNIIAAATRIGGHTAIQRILQDPELTITGVSGVNLPSDPIIPTIVLELVERQPGNRSIARNSRKKRSSRPTRFVNADTENVSVNVSIDSGGRSSSHQQIDINLPLAPSMQQLLQENRSGSSSRFEHRQLQRLQEREHRRQQKQRERQQRQDERQQQRRLQRQQLQQEHRQQEPEQQQQRRRRRRRTQQQQEQQQHQDYPPMIRSSIHGINLRTLPVDRQLYILSGMEETNDHKKQFQQHLQLRSLQKAFECRRNSIMSIKNKCAVSRCKILKIVIQHLKYCTDKTNCNFPECAYSRQVILHQIYCRNRHCVICMRNHESSQ